MAQPRFIEHDEMGVTREVWYDEGSRRMVHRTFQDAQSIVDENARRRTGDGYGPTGGSRMEASIPVALFNQWCYARGINLLSLPPDEFRREMLKFINDPDWQKVRTAAPAWRVTVPRLYAARRVIPRRALVAADKWTDVGPRPV